MRIKADLVIARAAQVVTADGDPGVVMGGSVAVAGDKVVWVGPSESLGVEVDPPGIEGIIDAEGCVVTPGFVDAHTHLVFAGSRPLEFEWRLQGRHYLDILAAGGGILSTVRSVRAASEDDLVRESLPRLERMLGFGVTSCEVKSGYGLDVANEMKILRAARRLAETQPVRIEPTFLGAHVIPPEHKDDPEGYVDLLVEEMIPRVAEEKLATACDVFIEKGAFTAAQAGRILEAAKAAGLRLHVHAGQFEDVGGPEAAARLGALSVDHLDVVSNSGLEAMARSSTIAVLLPGSSMSLGHEPPRVERILEAGVKVALATDCNPGTSYTENLPLMAFIGATRMGLSCAGALLAITRESTRAIGRPGPEGTIVPGATADLLVHAVGDWREILYHFGVPHVRDVVIGGRRVAPRR